ncbi:MAG: ABC transporter substrate-binding protein [Deltaproteobacteria bacterium]|nr:ABC transporter substrate-binding protein [Deltaproteobacteria bacterium]
MVARRKQVTLLGILAAVAILLLVFPFTMTAVSKESEDKPTWVWTKKNPKPVWWTWGKDYEPNPPARGGYLRLAAGRYIGLMNPNHWPVNDWNAMTYFYDFLLYNDGKFQPTVLFLADSYHYTDPKTVIMKLKKGVKFHDGANLNAAGLKYQMEWIKDKKNGAWSRAWIAPIKSVEVLDEYTVKFNFKKSWAGFPGIMATVPGFMISPKALKNEVLLRKAKKAEGKAARANKLAAKAEEKAKQAAAKGGAEAEKLAAKAKNAREKAIAAEEKAKKLAEQTKGLVSLDNHAVGCGKYMYDKASPGNFLKYKRNPNWWFGQSIGRPDMPYPDGVVITVIPDPSVQLANLRAGKIHVMGVSKSQYKVVKDDPNIKVHFSTWPHVAALRFNTHKGPCKDLRIRKAVSHAIDRKALVAGIQFGLATVASGMYPGKHWCHNPNLKPVSYDPELSKRLLAEAGYPDGLTIKGYMGNLPDDVALAEAVKNMLSLVGIDWKVDTLGYAATSDRMKNLDYDLAAGGWAFIWDPDMMATGLYHPDGGFNFGRSNNPRAIALIEAGKSEVNMERRQKIYWELEKVIYDNYEDAWLWYPKNITATRKNVCGYNDKLHDIGLEGFYHSHPIWLKDGKE